MINCTIFQNNIDDGQNVQNNTTETSSEKEKDKSEDREVNIINISSSCEKVLVCKYIDIFHIISILYCKRNIVHINIKILKTNLIN